MRAASAAARRHLCGDTNPSTDSVLQPSGKDALPAGLIQSPPSKKLHQLQNQVSKKGGWVEENYCERAIRRPAQVCQQFRNLPRSANIGTTWVPHWYHTDAALVPYKSNKGTTQVPHWYENGTNQVPKSNIASEQYIETCLGHAAIYRPAQVYKDRHHTCTT